MRPSSRSKPNVRLQAIESLEARIALSAEGLAWGNAPYLSISFAPDEVAGEATEIDGEPNQLFASMNAIAPEEVWQGAIVDAFQTWAHNTNGDIFVRSDSGDDFGVPGRTTGDERFGDVRIGAIPLRNHVFAIGVSRGFVSGTWAGDVLFNSNLFAPTAADPIDSVDDIFRIALHEAGHVFGFEDSSDPTDVMHAVGIPQTSQPSVGELDELWARFGQRSADFNERGAPDSNNNSPENGRATHMYSSSSGFDGTTPLINHGDLNANDVDYYRFDNLDEDSPAVSQEYVGDVTFEVRTAGLSQLQPAKLVLYDKDENLVATSRFKNVDADGSDGRVAVTLYLPPGDEGRYFVGVSSDADPNGIHHIGGYALVTTFDEPGMLQTSAAAIDRLSGNEFRFLDGKDMQDIFAKHPNGNLTPLFREDLHTNDTLTTASPLEPVPGFEEGVKYELLASISDNTDLDYYSFESADYGVMATDNVMTLLVETFENSEFEPLVEILDSTGVIVPHKQLQHHDGTQVIQLAELDQNTTYFMRVAADSGSAVPAGNYRISMRGGVTEQDLDVWRSGTTSAGAREFIYAATRPELTMFAIQGQGSVGDDLRVTVETLSGSIVTQFDAGGDDFRSTNSVLLERRAYRVRVESPQGDDLPFTLLTAKLTDPLAVGFADVDQTPVYHVDNFDGVFVFPGGGSTGGGSGSLQGATKRAHRSRAAVSLDYPDDHHVEDQAAHGDFKIALSVPFGR